MEIEINFFDCMNIFYMLVLAFFTLFDHIVISNLVVLYLHLYYIFDAEVYSVIEA